MIEEATETIQAIKDLRSILEQKGLDPYPINFEIVPADAIYEFAAYGVPGAFSHWSRGRNFYVERTEHDYGVARTHELVINSNPAYAFLLDTNTPIQNTLVIAHVLGHVDFYRNNVSFERTDKGILDTASAQATRLGGYRFRFGSREVERFLDAALSLEWQIDPSYDLEKWSSRQSYMAKNRKRFEDLEKQTSPKTEYDDLFNLGNNSAAVAKVKPQFPAEPERNLLMFLALHSSVLDDWQRDVLAVIHSMSQYFWPQRLTEIMNEGWASYWHVQALREYSDQGKVSQKEDLDWLRMHSEILTPSRESINPYHLGYYIWEDIARKYQGLPSEDGQKEYNWWGGVVDPGRFKGSPSHDIFTIRATQPSDQGFLRDYLTPQLIRRIQLYTYGYDGNDWVIKEKDPVKTKESLLRSLTNCGIPVVEVVEGGGDYSRRGGLYLQQSFGGQGIDLKYARKTLQNIYRLWGRKVYLEATSQEFSGEILKERRMLLTCSDGQSITERELKK